MNNRLKELFLGMVLTFVCDVFSMKPQQLACQFELQNLGMLEQQGVFCDDSVRARLQERILLRQLVTAKNLDHDALTTYSSKLLYINEKDLAGYTPLHHLMRHKDVRVEDVAFFIKHGACLNIKDDYGADPYHYSFNYQGSSPVDSGPLYNCDRTVVHFLHSEMLLLKLKDLAKQREGIEY
jgi:hypothetical protein